jgi:cytochrome d ubiquinol oxidase subunit I
MLARYQPVKLAAMEGQFRTEQGAPLRIGGIPDVESATTRHAIEIPYGLSLLAFHDPKAIVKGLEDFPRDVWPPVAIVHVAFQVMVAAGAAMALVALCGAYLAWRHKSLPDSRWFLRAVSAASPLGLIAIEAGWTVTEVGRQPWIIQGVMRTAQAVTPMPGLKIPFVTFTLVYVFLAAVVVWLLIRQVAESPRVYAEPAAEAERRFAPSAVK